MYYRREMIQPDRRQWLVTAAIAASIGLFVLWLIFFRVTSGKPIFVNYGAECKRQGPGSHLVFTKLDDGTQETSVLTCDQRSHFRSVEPR